MDDNYSQVKADAIPFKFHSNTTGKPLDALDSILDELSIDDYKSIFFLLLNSIGPSNYVYIITKDKEYLKKYFCEKYHEFPYKNDMLIEILGTMQKFRLLTLLNTCHHVFKSEKESFTQIHPLWKCLYSICEQLSDPQVVVLKGKLLPNTCTAITCAEQLFCEALRAQVFNVNDLSKLADVFETFHPECYNLITSYNKESKLRFYPIKTPTAESPCGLAVIVCQKKFRRENDNCPRLTDRPDSHHDVYALQKMWQSFGFKTKIYEDLTDGEVVELFHKLSASDHFSYSAFVACFLSHGGEGVIFASNCKPIAIADLISMMANNCSSLVNKPKLFFIQACQGNRVQEGVLNYSINEQVSRNSIDISYSKLCMDTPIFVDVLLVVASIQRYASYCPPGGNSWFIGDLVKVMNADGDKLTISSIITKVTDLVAQKSGVIEDEQYENCKQTTVTNSTLRRELKLKRLKSS